MVKRSFAVVCSLFVFALMLGGCGPKPQEPMGSKPIKVMYYSEDYFNQEYGELFATKFPDLEVEVVDFEDLDYSSGDATKAEMDFIAREQPDVLLLEAEQYEKYIGEGLLMELDPFIQKDDYDLQSVYPTVLELLKEKGQGKIYGLSPRFYGTAVFYNQALFERYGIELPREKMTWAELLDLAKRFPLKDGDGKRIYGFGLRDGAAVDVLADRMASTEGLTTVNPNQKKVVIASDAWKTILQQAVDACASGSVYTGNTATEGAGQDGAESDPFIQGNMAMTVEDLYLLYDLKRANNRNPAYRAFPLGVVAGPVDPRSRDSSNDIRLKEIFAIRNGSPNADAAWEFIKYVSGDEYAKVKGKSMDGNILARMGHYQEGDIDLNAFYSLRPVVTSSAAADDTPAEFYSAFQELMQRELQGVVEKRTSLEAALQKLQSEGQFMLEQSYKKSSRK